MLKLIQNYNINIYALIFNAILSACSQDHTNVEIKITAKSSDGKPVSGAEVTLDGERIAETNAFGEAKASSSLRTGKYHKLTLTKDDPRYYFAPHVEVFKAKQTDTQVLEVKPTMYLVPKPRYKPSDVATDNSKSEQPAPIPVVNTPVSNSQPPLVDQPMIQPAEKSKIASSLQQKQIFLTGHVYAGRLPLADARITWSNGKTFISCMSNERGRCLLKVPTSEKEQASILVQKIDYLSQILVTPNHDNENVRFSLQLGTNIAIRVARKTTWASHPISGAEVRLSGATRGTTNAAGMALLELGPKQSGNIDITDPESGENINIPVKEILGQESAEIYFADQKKIGWTSTLLLPLHGTSPLKGFEPDHLNHHLLADALHLPPKDDRSQDSEQTTAHGALEILPILHREQNQFQIMFQAISGQTPIAQSNPVNVKAPDLTSSWILAATQAYKELNQKLVGPGIVTKATKDELWLRFSANAPRIGDIIHIVAAKTSDPTIKHLEAKVTHGADGRLRAKILKKLDYTNETHPWSLIGAIAQPRRISTNQHSFLTSEELTQLNPADRAVTLAKKYLGENNVIQALKVLEENPTRSSNSQSHHKIKSEIYLSIGDMAAVEREQIEIMKSAIEHGHDGAATISEANILRIQAQNTPVIAKEPSIIESLTYLITRAETLLSETKDPTQILNFNLYYTKFLATRKKAECDDDLVTLASLSSDLKHLESLLDNLDGTADLKRSWRPLLDAEKSKISMSTAGDAVKF